MEEPLKPVNGVPHDDDVDSHFLFHGFFDNVALGLASKT